MAVPTPKRLEPLYFQTRQPVVPQRTPSFYNSEQWRFTAREPINRAYQRHIIRELMAMEARFIPRDEQKRDDEYIKKLVVHYSNVFFKGDGGWHNRLSMFVEDSLCLPFGGAMELGWFPGIRGLDTFPDGQLAWVTVIDGGTMAVNNDKRYPYIQVNPVDQQETIPFKGNEVLRLMYNPHSSLALRGYQESPTEQNFSVIEALTRLYVYDIKSLGDTPIAGILDLADFSEDDAVHWAKGFQEMMQGIEPLKLPILYQHERPARFVKLGEILDTKEKWKHYVEMAGTPYGLTVGSLGLFEHDRTLAGAREQTKTTRRVGVTAFAAVLKSAIDNVIPPEIELELGYRAVEDVVRLRTAEKQRVDAIATMVSMGLSPDDAFEQIIKDGILNIPIPPGTIKPGMEKVSKQTTGPSRSSPERAEKQPGEDELEAVLNKSMLWDDYVEKGVEDYEGYERDLAEYLVATFGELTDADLADLMEQVISGTLDIDAALDEYSSEFSVPETPEKTSPLIAILSGIFLIGLYQAAKNIIYELYPEIPPTLPTAPPVMPPESVLPPLPTFEEFSHTDATMDWVREHTGEMIRNINRGTMYYIRMMVAEGIKLGTPTWEIVDAIKQRLFEIPEWRIAQIVTYENAMATMVATQMQYKHVGLSNKRWVTRKVDVCPVCIDNESLGSQPMAYDQYKTVFGSETTEHPPAHPWCFCDLLPDVDEVRKLGEITWMGTT